MCPDNAIAFPFYNLEGERAVYRDVIAVRGSLYPFETIRSLLAENSNDLISLSDEWRGMDISNLFQPTSSACGAYSTTPVLDCSIPNPVDPSFPSLESFAGQLCPSTQWLEKTKPAGRLYFTWSDIRNQQNSLFAFNGKVIDVSSIILRSDQRNLTFSDPVVTLIKNSVGSDSTRSFFSNRESMDALNCLQLANVVGDLGEDTVGCVVNQTVLVFFIVVIFTVLFVKYAYYY